MLCSIRIDFGNVSLAMFIISLIICLGCKTTRSPFAPLPNMRTWRTISAPRLALDSIACRIFSLCSSLNLRFKALTDIMIGDNTLFKSCAIPPASVPILSRRCARMNCASNFLLSVTSVQTFIIDFGLFSLSVKSFHLQSRIISEPLRLTAVISPDHSPSFSTASRAATASFGISSL